MGVRALSGVEPRFDHPTTPLPNSTPFLIGTFATDLSQVHPCLAPRGLHGVGRYTCRTAYGPTERPRPGAGDARARGAPRPDDDGSGCPRAPNAEGESRDGTRQPFFLRCPPEMPHRCREPRLSRPERRRHASFLYLPGSPWPACGSGGPAEIGRRATAAPTAAQGECFASGFTP